MSGLRCRAGDLAVIVAVSPAMPELTGSIVDVVHIAPAHDFKLPDGHWHEGVSGGQSWVVKFHRPIRPSTTWGLRTALYAVAPDRALQPIRGQRQPESITTTAPDVAHA